MVEAALSIVVLLLIGQWSENNDNISKVPAQGASIIGSRVLGPNNVDMIISNMSLLQGGSNDKYTYFKLRTGSNGCTNCTCVYGSTYYLLDLFGVIRIRWHANGFMEYDLAC